MNNSSPKLLTLLARAGLFVPVLALITLFAQNGRADTGNYAATVQADGPIAYWRFNDTPPTAINSGNLGAAANGTYNGSATAGVQAPRPPAFVGFEANNTALQCDGVNAFVTAASLMNGKPAFTISGWMRRNGTQNNRTGLWGQNDIVEFGYIDNTSLELWTDNGLHTCAATPCPAPVPDGQWAHFAVVSDGSPGTASLYTNGVFSSSRAHSIPGDNAFPFNIGGGGIFDDIAANGNYFNGQIDEVAVYDKALSAAQIAAHYSAAFSPLANVFSAGDPIVLVNGVNDGDGDAGPPPGAETVDHAIDRVTQKYLNFLDLGSGFATTPSVGLTIASCIRFYTANDAEERDPASYVLEGSTSGTGGPWTLIASGPLSLPSGRNGGGATPIDPATQFNQLVAFPNTAVYSSYRVTFPTLKNAGAANSMQIAEVELLGIVVARPASIVTQPADQTVRQGLSATFSVAAEGTQPLNYEWLRKLTTDADFLPIAGANSASYTTPPTIYPDDDNSLFKVRVNNALGMVESRAALLRVLSDTNPPTIVSSAGSGDFMHATILFSEELEMGTAGDTFNYVFSGGIGVLSAALSADRRSVTLTTDLQTPDTLYTITVNNVADLAGLAVAPDSMTSYRTWTTGPCNGVLFEAYDTLPQSGNRVAVSLLTGHPNFPNNPRDVALIAALDSRLAYPDDSHEDYGGRMRGVFFPRESGLHTFYLAADDNAELWLSTDLSPANKVLIARETMWSNTKEWTASAGASDVNAKRSAPIHLVGGQPYYIEALYKEGGGGDHCSVAVQTPIDAAPPANGSGEIPASLLGSPNAPAGFAGNITITTPPTDQTAVQCRSATFSVAASNPNDLFMCFQWQLNGVDIPGATKSSYTTPPAALSDEGAVYTVNITLFGGASASASAVLHVTPDTTPPDCPTASGVSVLNQVQLMFNEVLDATSAENEANYSIAGFNIDNAALDASKTKVILTVSPLLTPGAAYSVAVQGATDCSGNAVSACAAGFQAWQLCVGGATREFYRGMGGVDLNDLRNSPKYPNSPDDANVARLLETPIDNQMQDGGNVFDNYGSRVSGFLVAPVSGNYHFFISSDDRSGFYLSTDANPANLALLCREPEWNGLRNWNGAARRNAAALENQSQTLFPAGIPLVAGQLYYFETLMKEGGGGDGCEVTWQTPAGGPSPGAPVNADGVDGAGSGGNGNGGTKAILGRYLARLVPPGTDTAPASITSAKVLCPRNRVVVEFSEVVQLASAENVDNYAINGGSGVTSATLRPDEMSVELTTAANVMDGSTITVSGVADCVGNTGNASAALVVVAPYTASGPQNLIVIEAEHIDNRVNQAGLQPWSLQNSLPGYSGDGWAEVVPAAIGNFGNGGRRFHGNTQPLFGDFGARADYCVNFPVAGEYRIWIRGSTPNGTFNSFHMGLDGVSAGDNVQRLGNRINNWGGNATAFGWHNDAQSNPARITVASAGLHTINIWPREDGTRLDKIVLTTDTAFTIGRDEPGPAESVRNQCPTANPLLVSVDPNSQVSFQLPASDPNGDALQYIITQAPACGTLTLDPQTGAGTYTATPGCCDPNNFKYKVTDGQCESAEALVTIDVRCNRCPTACITTIALCTELGTNVFISPNGSNACFVLDASCSSDPDGDPLTYFWYLDPNNVPFATGVRITNCLDLGEHGIGLLVDDGRCSRSVNITVEVLSGCEAVEDLIAKVNDASLTRANKRPLIATLKAACASFERGSFESAVGQLGAFINKVAAQIAPANPDEAALFTRCAQAILDSVACEEAGGP